MPLQRVNKDTKALQTFSTSANGSRLGLDHLLVWFERPPFGIACLDLNVDSYFHYVPQENKIRREIFRMKIKFGMANIPIGHYRTELSIMQIKVIIPPVASTAENYKKL
ncbi:8717_t:CDS:2 [Funneliformis mosseae]|uniref:8717_t:CDS:1 n=1 Tax=Funneliformis mosseae TaxID=27381 RepID=A0A9N9GFE3_FUNMO|nr:8717_t:CDS:2 [Funneliformis mosseae]